MVPHGGDGSLGSGGPRCRRLMRGKSLLCGDYQGGEWTISAHHRGRRNAGRFKLSFRRLETDWKGFGSKTSLLTNDMGTSVHAIKGLAAQSLNMAKRARAILDHNALAREQRMHLCGLWQAKERPRCTLCAYTGYATRQLPSMRGEMSWVGWVGW